MLGDRASKKTQPHRGCVGLKINTQGSRGGNPGLEAATASRLFGSFAVISQVGDLVERVGQFHPLCFLQQE
jgi:hypothetical protein